MNTLTKKDKLALQVSLTLVAGMFSLVPVAQGAPVLEKKVTTGTIIDQKTTPNVTTIRSNDTGNNVINWKDFSIKNGEQVIFDATSDGATTYTKTNNYLNVVTGAGTSFIDGDMKGGKNVYLVNPNGIIMGENAYVDVGNLYISTKQIDPNSFSSESTLNDSKSVLGETDPKAEVVNMGTIQANSVYAEGTSVRFFNTANIQYKPDNDCSDTKNTPLSAINGTNGTVTLNAIDYVSVGYERTNYDENDENSIAQYTDADKVDGKFYGQSAKELKYEHNNEYTQKATVAIDDYMLVRTEGELININNNPSGKYMLAKSLDFEGQPIKPIGVNKDEDKVFTGKFEGNFFEIKGIYVATPDLEPVDYAGLFGATKNATIRNVGVVDPYIYTSKYGGGIAGHAVNTTFQNIYVKKGEMDPGDVGIVTEIIPRDQNGNILDQNHAANANYYSSAAEAVGGLVGYADNCNIDNAYNAVNVFNGAGLVGSLNNESSLTNAYNKGEIHLNVASGAATNIKVTEHYAIYDYCDDTSSVRNVYNTANTYNDTSHYATVTDVADKKDKLVSKIDPSGKATNAYVVDITSANAMKASSYAFFPSGKSKDDDGIWRIYEGHSLPLLRSFLKANGKGTVPVGYNLALYANATKNETTGAYGADDDDAPTMKLKGSSADGKITYNGYYIGGADVEMDNSRGLDSEKVKSNTTSLIKNVGETNIFFYSVDQDGYDLATEALTVAARPLANPAGIKNVDKVYDGTTAANTALANQFGKTINLLDYKVDPNDKSAAPLVEDPGYGIVEVYQAGGTTRDHTDDVALNDKFIKSADYADKTSGEHQSDASIQSVVNTTHPNDYVITVDADEDMTVTLKNSKKTSSTDPNYTYDDARANDYKNYSLTAADVENISITGDITLRPVKFGLHTDDTGTSIDKVYDTGSNVVYVGSASDPTSPWTPNVGSTLTAKDNVYYATGDSATGLVGSDVNDGKVALVVATPYYTTDTSGYSKPDSADAGDEYKAVYKFVLRGDAAKNYHVESTDKSNVSTVTDADTAEALYGTKDNGSDVYLLTGNGKIDKRHITAENISFYKIVKDANNNDTVVWVDGKDDQGNAVHGTKVYNHSANFEDAEHVSFSTSNVVKVEDALNLVQDTGVIEGDEDEITNALSVESAVFVDAEENGSASYSVGDKYIKYTLGTSTGDIWKNYTLDNNVVVNEGTITHRILTIGMRERANTESDVDKVYDADKAVVDKYDRGYLGFQGTEAENKHDTGYVTYAGSTKLMKDSGASEEDVGWDISGEYQAVPATATTGEVAAEDVYLVNDTPSDKGVIYTVKLKNGDASNYKLKTADMDDADAVLATTGINLLDKGTIDQLTLNPTFANIEKQYDGTILVLPDTVTFSDNTTGTLTPQTSTGITAESQMHNVTLPTAGTVGGLLTADAGLVGLDPESLTAVFDSANAGTRTVTYSGLKLTAVDNSSKVNNYKLAPTYTNTGTITRLLLDANNLTPEYNEISKTYNANKDLENDASSYVKGIAISGVAGTGANLTILPGTTGAYVSKNRGGSDGGHDVTFNFSVKDESGNYYFGKGNNDQDILTYNFSNTTNTGIIKARNVTPVVNGTLTKTYDGMAEYTDGERTELTGDGIGTLTLNGIISGDATNISTAVYDNANAGPGKTVTYTPLLQTGDPTNYNITSTTITGDGTINKRKLTLTFNPLSKKYDTETGSGLTAENIAGMGITLDDGTDGTDAKSIIKNDGTQAALNAANLGTALGHVYGKLTDAATGQQFEEKSNAGGVDSIQYTGLNTVLGNNVNNYDLYYNAFGTTPNAHAEGKIVDGVGYGEGSIGKKTLHLSDIVADFSQVNKIYDAGDGVGYTHYKIDGYDTGTADSVTVTANSFVNSLKIDGQTVTYAEQGNSGYSIKSANYNTKNTDAQSAVFQFKIGTDWTDNYNFEGDGISFDNGNPVATISTNGVITAKTIYAALSEQYSAPTKVYDSTKAVKNGNNVVSAAALVKDTQDNKAKYGNYVTVSGLMGDDASKVTAEALYDSAHVADKVANLGNAVNYTLTLDNSIAGNYNLEGVDADNKLQGAGEITPKGIYLKSDGVANKTYDATETVKLKTGAGVSAAPTLSIEGVAENDAIAVAIEGDNAIVGTYGNDTNGFTKNADVAFGNDYKAVQYTNVLNSLTPAEGTYLTDYTFGSGGGGLYSEADNGTVTFASTAHKGQIGKLTVTSIKADIGQAEKVYDSTTDLENLNHVNGVKLVSDLQLPSGEYYTVTLSGGNKYTIDGKYTDSNASPNADKQVDYTFTIDKSIFQNLVYSSYDGSTDYNGKVSTNNNIINPRPVYATLSNVNPTKTYDGNNEILGKAKNGNDTIDQAMANSYVNIAGWVENDPNTGSYTVMPTYIDKNVARDPDTGNVVAKTVNYAVSGINSNYQLYVGDTATNILTGQGLIKPKEITLNVSPVQKVYDGTDKTAIDITAANPTITTGVIDAGTNLEETFILDKNLISGQYGNYDANGFVANGDVNYGTNYEDSAGYKAVQYAGLNEALANGNHSGTANVDNYELVGTMSVNNPGGYAYDATQGTITFSEEGAKGRITRRPLEELKTKWESVDKQYDATSSIAKEDINKAFKIYTDVEDKLIYIDYDLSSADYTDENGNAQKNVGSYNMRYVLNGITGKDLHNFSMGNLENAFKNKAFDSKNGNATYNVNGSVAADQDSAVNGSITQRIISGKYTGAVQDKVYGQDYGTGNLAAALSSSTYFNIDGDDLGVLEKDGKDSTVLTVSGVYSDKNANYNPGEEAGNHKDVYFTIGWADNQTDTGYQSNYIFDTNNGTGVDYKGAGDIQKRIVYVIDNGGTVQEKTYDGTDTVGTVDTSGKFTLAPLSGNTGVIVADEEKVTLAANITNVSYDGSDVERDNTGKVVNKGIIYTGTLALSGDAADVANYYMDTSMDKAVLSDSNGNSVVSNVSYLNTGGNNYTITEDKGGRINPIEITIGLTNSPTKIYDTKTSVTGNYNDDVPYASVSNLKAASDKASTTTDFQSVNDRTLKLTLNPRTDVNETVKVTMSGGNYSNKNAGSDKVTSYTLTWDNPNYELVGETTTTNAGQDKDTFDVTSYDSADPANKRVSGILKDYRGTITPFDLSIASMDSSKTYDGNTDANVPDVTVTFSDASKNMLVSDGANINNMLDFLGFKVTDGTYGGPTDEALAAAEADGNISDGDIATTTASDASFNEKSAPFVHKVTYDGISITNGNYRIGDSSFAGTGTINRAPITAKANDALVKVGEAMPKFSGTMFGFVSKTDADRYNGLATWGPEAGVSTGEAGTNPVYGWYRNLKSGVNLGKNYVLEYQQPGTFTVEADMAGDMIGYLDKPVVPDNKVYQNVSKDENKSHNHEPKAAIQYGNTGTGIVADRDEGGSSGTIAIELAEVVNLLGGEVASDGTMSLANQERKSSLSVGSTSEGFLSVGNGDNEASGQTDLFSEGEIAIENKDGEIGLENEENLWQGQAELAMAEGSILSDGQIANEEDEKDKDKKKKTLEEKTEHEASATITYGDVA